MIPFEYRAPRTLDEALSLLRTFGEDARPLAGGTALVLMMRQRLVRPACLVDLRGITALGRIASADGSVEIGACVTHREAETSPIVRVRLPALAETYHHVATIRIRNMATVGGGLAHADPNQDPPVTLLALGARVRAQGPQGERQIALEEFLLDYYQTSLAADELVTGVTVPVPGPRTGCAFLKFLPRTADDYATVCAAAVVTLDASGKRCAEARIGLGCVGVTPLRATAAEDLLRGRPLSDDLLRAAGEAAKAGLDPIGDHRGSSEYKRDMAAVFLGRAVRAAWARARRAAERSSASRVRAR
jgi:aerobic carbon-monoxide dehydrogenase medium subunit